MPGPRPLGTIPSSSAGNVVSAGESTRTTASGGQPGARSPGPVQVRASTRKARGDSPPREASQTPRKVPSFLRRRGGGGRRGGHGARDHRDRPGDRERRPAPDPGGRSPVQSGRVVPLRVVHHRGPWSRLGRARPCVLVRRRSSFEIAGAARSVQRRHHLLDGDRGANLLASIVPPGGIRRGRGLGGDSGRPHSLFVEARDLLQIKRAGLSVPTDMPDRRGLADRVPPACCADRGRSSTHDHRGRGRKPESLRDGRVRTGEERPAGDRHGHGERARPERQ